jgi:hypothetical protein
MDGARGMDGSDGEDGVSVTNAFIDFDGSLVINLSDGQSLNVGEVVAPDLAEKIKVITNGGGTSQGVLDTLTSLQNQINLISSALVYKGTWNASTNTPALASGVGTANSFYIVSVAGTTTLDGISNWGVGDWATFNGTAWQRVEGGAAGNFTDLSASGAVTLSGGTANGVAYLNGSKVLTTGSGLVFDSSGNLGIGTSSPSAKLHVQGNTFRQNDATNSNGYIIDTSTTTTRLETLFGGSSFAIRTGASASNRMFIDSSGNLGIGTSSPAVKFVVSNSGANGYEFDPANSFISSYNRSTSAWTAVTFRAGGYTWNINNSNDALKLDSSGNLGIGTSSPAFNSGSGVEIERAGIANLRLENSSAGNNFELYSDSLVNGINLRGFNGSPMVFWTANTERMRLDSSGNLGLGVTPSAWEASYKAFQFGAGSAFLAGRVGSLQNRQVFLGIGASNNGTNWLYTPTGVAISYYAQIDGAHQWFNAPSGTAGATVTFTQAMTLNASGNLGIGTTSPTAKLEVTAGATGVQSLFSHSSGTPTIAVGATTTTYNTQIGYNVTSEYGYIQATAAAGVYDDIAINPLGGNLGIGTTSPSASAILDAQSTTKGVRMPNMTTTQKNAIASPAAGLMVFDTTLAKLCVYTGAAWQTITSV